MLLDELGQSFEYDDVTYTVGMSVVANSASDFRGLIGRIVEIRTEDDVDSDYDPEICCDFDPPADALDLMRIEAVITELAGAPVTIAELCVEPISLPPHMLDPIE